MARAPVRKLGNSCGVLIPRPLLSEAGLGVGDSVDMTFEHGRIVLIPIKRRSRTGWAEASKALVAADEPPLVWPEFPNAGDDDLVW